MSLKMLALALLLTVVTGFDGEKPPAGTQVTPKDVPGFELQQKTPKSPARPAGEPGSDSNWRRDRKLEPNPIDSAGPNRAAVEAGLTPGNVLSWETGAGKSYLIPALEVTGFLGLLHIYDRIAYSNQTEDGTKVYSSTFSSIWEHLSQQDWVFDKDPFNVNQFGHPYQGATMYGLARSSGLNFWESLAYSNAGSFMWEMAGETGRPSVNDLITTGNAGSLLGEALFRMSELVLQDPRPRPGALKEIGAAIISPPTAFNRYAFGDRLKTVFPTYDPATFWRFRLGVSMDGSSKRDAILDFGMSYGLPGKPGYTYKRPLDYFDFQISGLDNAKNPVENVLLRGLLYGKQYQAGNDYRGIWGLYGSYDYISPAIFRVSSTALSLGTTGQYWVGPGIALQGSLLGGVGFGAAGVTQASGERDYHYGTTPQGLLALRLLFGDRAMLEVAGRGYFVSGTGSDDARGSERIVRASSNLNVRVYGRHGIGLQYVKSIRDARYGTAPNRHQSDGTASLVYTFLGDTHFGAVEWRHPDDH
ncbi:MAG: hypothetical protein A2075_03190 [Geobacteraceae bacterium GWC2_58_44]|nr:MAG: hypothetical protein A2075_03190 [Geobacteraceae bacterium GWC2_58_44]HBG05837.1 DUF3943 domain-containing protein [Geobacter sp.]